MKAKTFLNELVVELRKKNNQRILLSKIDKLLLFESEIHRQVKKCFNNQNELQIESGDLRLICRAIKTQYDKYSKSLYYEKILDDFKNFDIITDKEFTDIFNKSISNFKLCEKLLKAHYLYGSITAMVEILERTRNQNANN